MVQGPERAGSASYPGRRGFDHQRALDQAIAEGRDGEMDERMRAEKVKKRGKRSGRDRNRSHGEVSGDGFNRADG